MTKMRPGRERDRLVIGMEDKQGMRARSESQKRSESGKRLGSPGGDEGPVRPTQPHSEILAPALEGAAQDKNRNTLPAAGAGHQDGC